MIYRKQFILPLEGNDINTRKKRRRMVKLIRMSIDNIHFAEGMYMTRIPNNLKDSAAYYEALACMDLLEEAISVLGNAYD